MMRRLLLAGAALPRLRSCRVLRGERSQRAGADADHAAVDPAAGEHSGASRAEAESRQPPGAEEIDRSTCRAQVIARRAEAQRPPRPRRPRSRRKIPRSRRSPRRRSRRAPSNMKTTALQPQVPAASGDVAFGAYQRGYYLDRLQGGDQRRASEQGDPVAMTLLGELYANGYGVAKDEKKALAWFSLAADRGDRQAMFALAMFRFAGRGGAQDQAEAAALLDKAAKLGHVAAAYNLALLYLEGQQVRQDVRARRRTAARRADAGSPEAQYALATLYKEGNGVPKDAARGDDCSAPRRAPAMSRPRSSTPSRCSTAPASTKDESGAAAIFRKAATKGNAIAQNRLARILATGRGVPADPVEATKWHIIAKAGGASRHLARRLHAEDQGQRARGRREGRAALARARDAAVLTLTFRPR